MRNQASKPPASQGGKVVACARCNGDIQPYTGREVAHGKFSHHPGQCADVAERNALPANLARQGTLFGWRCDRTEVDAGSYTPEICAASGTDRAGYAAHMAGHGRKPLSGVTRIKPRKSFARAALPAISVAKPFKWITWTDKSYSEWEAGKGQTCTETPRRGQYARGDDTYTPDWSEAASARREANRRTKRYGQAA